MPRRKLEGEDQSTTGEITQFGIEFLRVRELFVPGERLCGPGFLTSTQNQTVSRFSHSLRVIAGSSEVKRGQLVDAIGNAIVKKMPEKEIGRVEDPQILVGIKGIVDRILFAAFDRDLQQWRDNQVYIQIGYHVARLTGRSGLELLVALHQPGVTSEDLIKLWMSTTLNVSSAE